MNMVILLSENIDAKDNFQEFFSVRSCPLPTGLSCMSGWWNIVTVSFFFFCFAVTLNLECFPFPGKIKTVLGACPHYNFGFWGLMTALIAYLVPDWRDMQVAAKLSTLKPLIQKIGFFLSFYSCFILLFVELSCCDHWKCCPVDLLCSPCPALQRLLGFPRVVALAPCKWTSRGGWGHCERDCKVWDKCLIKIKITDENFQRTNGRVLPAQWRLLPPSKSSHIEGLNFHWFFDQAESWDFAWI